MADSKSMVYGGHEGSGQAQVFGPSLGVNTYLKRSAEERAVERQKQAQDDESMANFKPEAPADYDKPLIVDKYKQWLQLGIKLHSGKITDEQDKVATRAAMKQLEYETKTIAKHSNALETDAADVIKDYRNNAHNYKSDVPALYNQWKQLPLDQRPPLSTVVQKYNPNDWHEEIIKWLPKPVKPGKVVNMVGDVAVTPANKESYAPGQLEASYKEFVNSNSKQARSFHDYIEERAAADVPGYTDMKPEEQGGVLSKIAFDTYKQIADSKLQAQEASSVEKKSSGGSTFNFGYGGTKDWTVYKDEKNGSIVASSPKNKSLQIAVNGGKLDFTQAIGDPNTQTVRFMVKETPLQYNKVTGDFSIMDAETGAVKETISEKQAQQLFGEDNLVPVRSSKYYKIPAHLSAPVPYEDVKSALKALIGYSMPGKPKGKKGKASQTTLNYFK